MHFDLKIGLSCVSKSIRSVAVEVAAGATVLAVRAGLAMLPDSTSSNPIATTPRTIRMR
jgi:hypothetical protein